MRAWPCRTGRTRIGRGRVSGICRVSVVVALARETNEELLSSPDTTQTATLRTGLRRIADSTGLTYTKFTQS